MRSYLKIIEVDSGLIVPAKFAAEIGISGTVKRLQFPEQLAATQGFNLLKNVAVWIGFNQFPQNLTFGSLDTSGATITARNNDGTVILQSATGDQLANSCYQVLDYDSHPLN